MNEYTDAQKVEMLRRSYMAVDGLWFVIDEQRQGFAEALAADEEVWRIMPKIQARKAREVLGITGSSLADLAECLGLKLACEGHDFAVHLEPDRLEIAVSHCAWHDVFEKAERLHIAQDIARNICVNEGEGWAREFGRSFEFDLAGSHCGGGSCCRFIFT